LRGGVESGQVIGQGTKRRENNVSKKSKGFTAKDTTRANKCKNIKRDTCCRGTAGSTSPPKKRGGDTTISVVTWWVKENLSQTRRREIFRETTPLRRRCRGGARSPVLLMPDVRTAKKEPRGGGPCGEGGP